MPPKPCPGCADLRAKLREAKLDVGRWQVCAQWMEAERDRAVGELVAEVGRGHEWDEKYDAAIERAVAVEEKYDLALNACHIGLRLNDEYRERAETAERERDDERFCRERLAEALELSKGRVNSLEQQLEVLQWKFYCYESDAVARTERLSTRAEAAEAKVEGLAQAAIGEGYKLGPHRLDHEPGWRCKLCRAWWPLNTEPQHEDDCVLAPAEAQKEGN